MVETLRRLAVLCVGFILLPDMSRAVSCEALEGISALSVSNFAQTPAAPDADAQCDVVRDLSGQRDFYCSWEYQFREQAAQDRFDALQLAITECFAGDLSVRNDPDVNHPDFYDLRQYRRGTLALSVSLKDKGDLQKTYVFLRIGQRPLE